MPSPTAPAGSRWLIVLSFALLGVTLFSFNKVNGATIVFIGLQQLGSQLSIFPSPTGSASATGSSSASPTSSPTRSAVATSSPTRSAVATSSPTLSSAPSNSGSPSALPSQTSEPSSSVFPAPPSASPSSSVAPSSTSAPADDAISTAASDAIRQRLAMHLPPDSCGAVSPYTGTVSRTTPPYYHASNCKAYAYTPEQAGKCLSGRNVYVMGNSVGRGYAFTLPAMVSSGGAIATDRTAQKLACQKAPPEEEDTHPQSCSFEVGSGTSVFFLWRQYLAEEQNAWKPKLEGDFCTGSTAHDCYSKFLSSSKEGDILLFQQGLLYARYFPFIPDGERMPAAPAAEARFAATEFVRHMSELFHGSVVVAANISPMLPKMYEGVRLSEWPLGTNARAAALNAVWFPIYRAAGFGIIDQRTINLKGYETNESLYEDHVHFPGPLSEAAWHYALSMACGDPTATT